MGKKKKFKAEGPGYALVEAWVFYTRKPRTLGLEALPEFINGVADVDKDKLIELIEEETYHRPGYLRINERENITTHIGECYNKAIVVEAFHGTVRITWARGRTK
jgi:hypothetical protein